MGVSGIHALLTIYGVAAFRWIFFFDQENLSRHSGKKTDCFIYQKTVVYTAMGSIPRDISLNKADSVNSSEDTASEETQYSDKINIGDL